MEFSSPYHDFVLIAVLCHLRSRSINDVLSLTCFSHQVILVSRTSTIKSRPFKPDALYTYFLSILTSSRWVVVGKYTTAFSSR